ncbi:PorT family protein [Aureispira anguillae]|uniref:PorT family protein n=1 Tax=Aureispira anguillae TaxID=2864201 RepID=A0A915YJX7_9BACT|nr:PorT family protein [Aureispira anguillae]BDS14332.1 PorT family protein [Aureispira anguillae]
MNFIKTVQIGLALVGFLAASSLQAQDLFKPKFGLRAGASFSTMFGPQENGVEENHKLTVRVSAGGTVKFPLHERFGIAAEVVFVQKGSYYTATAENSFLKLPSFNTEQAFIYGYNKVGSTYSKRTDRNYKRRVGMNIINAYIEIPVMFYFEALDDRLQFDVGAGIGFLIDSKALGTIKFGDADILNADNPDVTQFIEMDLDYKMIKDELGALYDGTSKSAKIDGTTRYYPRGPSAYYFTDVEDKANEHIFKTIDLTLQAGVSYYFTPGLRAGLRFSYSFLDITTNKYDYSMKDLNSDGTYIQRNDHDGNLGFQLFVGLQF